MKPIIGKTRPKINRSTKIVDAYTGALEELFFLKHPALKKAVPETQSKLKKFLSQNKINGLWIYYPEKNILVNTVNEKDYFKLRTARNKNLITEKEQENFRKLSVGIAGLSVGSCILSALVTSGGPKKIKIADFDNLEITNLNRIKAKLIDVGSDKTAIAAREVWDLDPFAELTLFNQGVTNENLKGFLFKKPALNVFIDEMDSLPLKFEARLLCKAHKIPVVMATDNGDAVVLDVERFDLEPKREIFHGLLGKMNSGNFKNLNYKQWLSMATKIVGPEYLTPAMQTSLLEIGKTLPAVPQLGAIAGVAGAAICLALRRIANKQPMPSGRYVISLEEKLFPDFFSKKNMSERHKQTKHFKKTFN